jgi:hypothetical protein
MGKNFLKRGELGGWDLWCLWEFVVHSNGQCDQRSVSTKLFPYSQPEKKNRNYYFLLSFLTFFLFCTLPIHILDEERERERERERYLNNFKLFWCKQTKEEVPSSSWFLKSILWR